MPKRRSGLGVHGGERATVFAEKDNPAVRRKHAAPAIGRPCLRILPDDLACPQIERAQNLFTVLSGDTPRAAAVEGLALLPPRRRFRVDRAPLARHHLIQTRGWSGRR